MDTLLKDLRFALRALRKHPGFTALVVLTLALGIGSSTSIFSVVNSVLLRQLPYRNSARIVAIQELNPDGKRIQVTSANFLDWRAQNSVFEQLASFRTDTTNLATPDQAERLFLAVASANFFQIFGQEAYLGRLFIPADEHAGHAPIAVISYSLWQRRFAGDRHALGSTITLDGKAYSVVGVTAPLFQYPDKTEVWLPPARLVPELNDQMDVTTSRGMGYLSAVALLKPGVSVQQAAAEMDTITTRLRQQYPETNNRRFNRVVSLQDHLVGETSKLLWILLGAVTFVLLIACANVANLLLALGVSRYKEIAIRSALGASRWRVVRQLLTESILMSLSGGALGLLVAQWGVALLLKLLPADFPRLNEINIDWRVLCFAVGASLLTGLLFGLAPALQASSSALHQSLKESSRGASAGLMRSRMRRALIVVEVALSVVLLVGAGLLFRSFLHLQTVNTGFQSEQVLTARLSPSGSDFRNDDDYVRFYDRAMLRLTNIAGVEDVGLINTLPLAKGPTLAFRIDGRELTTVDKWPPANYRSISPQYFRTMNIPLLEGRPFDEHDSSGAPLVLMVNEALARRDFPGEDPVGKRVTFGRTNRNGSPVWFEIVGVASNSRSSELREEPPAEIYFSYLQDPSQEMSLVMRTTGDPSTFASGMKAAIAEVNKSVPVSDMKTMDLIVSESITQPRFTLFLLIVFGSFALLLSAAGIYGVTAYSVSQRTHELGIRLALGAQVSDVVKLILRQGLATSLLGLLIGLVLSFGLTKLIKSLLFDVSDADPLTFGVITLLLFLVALLACYIPARRATKVDPLVAFRYE